MADAMTAKDARDVLTDYNRWRRGDDSVQMGDQARIGQAIDALIALAEQPAQGEAVASDHWSDCATSNGPAYPVGPCDCMPTPSMCRAAVEYMNGADVYERLPAEPLAIEEGIYAEVWKAMQAKAPPAPAMPDDVAAAARHFKVEGGHIGGLGVSRAANILFDYINGVLASAPEVPRG